MNIPDNLKPWQHIVQCKVCKDIFWSRYSGEFSQCLCGASFVDSTPHYSRYGGEAQVLIPNLQN